MYAISSKFGKFLVNIRVVVAREAYKEDWCWLQNRGSKDCVLTD
jgi:hypothetical protein